MKTPILIAAALLATSAAVASHAATAPAASGPGSGSPSDPCPTIGTIAEAKGPFPLTGERMIRLETACGHREMTDHIRSYGKDLRYLLVADDLRASVQPGTVFHLRLGRTRSTETAVIGAINFFAAKRPGAAGPPHSISFDVTETIRSLVTSGWPAQGLGVAIAPTGEVAPGADATVGALRLVAQERR